jgi:hypothetical protein
LQAEAEELMFGGSPEPVEELVVNCAVHNFFSS